MSCDLTHSPWASSTAGSHCPGPGSSLHLALQPNPDYKRKLLVRLEVIYSNLFMIFVNVASQGISSFTMFVTDVTDEARVGNVIGLHMS